MLGLLPRGACARYVYAYKCTGFTSYWLQAAVHEKELLARAVEDFQTKLEAARSLSTTKVRHTLFNGCMMKPLVSDNDDNSSRKKWPLPQAWNTGDMSPPG